MVLNWAHVIEPLAGGVAIIVFGNSSWPEYLQLAHTCWSGPAPPDNAKPIEAQIWPVGPEPWNSQLASCTGWPQSFWQPHENVL